MSDFKEVITSLGQMPVGKGQGKSALRNALAPGLLSHPCRLALHPGTAREGRAWSKIRIPAKREVQGAMERFASQGSESEHGNISVLAMRGRFPQRHKLNLAVPLGTAFSLVYDRYSRQSSDTTHVLSKDKMQK